MSYQVKKAKTADDDGEDIEEEEDDEDFDGEEGEEDEEDLDGVSYVFNFMFKYPFLHTQHVNQWLLVLWWLILSISILVEFSPKKRLSCVESLLGFCPISLLKFS